MVVIFKIMNHVKNLEKMIYLRKTGTTAEIAEKMNISTRHVFTYLDFIKQQGGEITYDSSIPSYVYTGKERLKFDLVIKKARIPSRR